MSIFDSLKLQPADPILGLCKLFQDDGRPHKINLGIGSYKDAEGRSVVLSSIRKAEKIIFEQGLDKEYIPIDGTIQFQEEISKLVFGSSSPLLTEGRIYTAQTVAGTGALRMGAELLKEMGFHSVYVSRPTWSNHPTLLLRAGLKAETYPYYDEAHHALDYEGMCSFLAKLPERSIILLHACCHNPTGAEPSLEQWRELSLIMKKRRHIPFFDLAYQGFKEGVEEDAAAVRLFAAEGHEMLVASSYSKNFGLYGERVGALSIAAPNREKNEIVASNLKNIIRGSYSSPPLHGARILIAILSDPGLKAEWLSQLSSMRERLSSMRRELLSRLAGSSKAESLQHIGRQHGLFSLLGLTEKQVLHLRDANGIYMPSSGRINIAGLNANNLNTFIEALEDVYKSF